MRRSLISFGLAALFVLIWPATALAANPPTLTPQLAQFAVLAGSGTSLTNTGPSWVTGEIGASTAISGFQAPAAPTGPGMSGVQHLGDGVYIGAETDLVTAYNSLSQTTTTDYSNVNLGGLTLGPGVYNQTTAPVLTGTLTLNGPGIYIFKVGSTLRTAAGTPGAPCGPLRTCVVLINGAQPCDVFWQVATSATLFTYTAFIGTIMAMDGIQMQTGATLWGRALARTAAVTLDTNRIIVPSGCTTGLMPNFVAPTFVPSPAGNTVPPLLVVLPASLGTIFTAVVPGSTGIPEEMRGEFPWLLLIAVGAGLGATALGISSRRRRRRNA
jgi:Ice-binding-like